MLIDAHNHPDYHGYTVEKIIRDMDEQGIDKTWLLTWDVPQSEYNIRTTQNTMAPGSESGIPIDRILAAGAAAPDRFVLGYAPHPKRPDSIERINSAVSLYDIRLAGEYKSRTMFDDPDSLGLLRRFGELALPVTIHLEYGTDSGQSNYPWRDWWYGGTIGALDRMLASCPETIIVAHGPGWWSHISNDDLFDKEMYPNAPVKPGGANPALLEKHPNLYADLSATSGYTALTRDPEFGRQYLIDHSDKLLFARDIYDNKLMDHLNTLALPSYESDKIMYGNAEKLVSGEGLS
ncbi:MAG: amidohydrolase family protein [SAR202 cluster bacterium]|nr:amidohydrolase family protein [SAR202 cluster bacterium]